MPISRAAARQRAGRAGRQCPGKCFRLYTEDLFYSADLQVAHDTSYHDRCYTLLQTKIVNVALVAAIVVVSLSALVFHSRYLCMRPSLYRSRKCPHLTVLSSSSSAILPRTPDWLRLLGTDLDFDDEDLSGLLCIRIAQMQLTWIPD